MASILLHTEIRPLQNIKCYTVLHSIALNIAQDYIKDREQSRKGSLVKALNT